MDDLYDNLDNYNEEYTISELQTENKDLKSKLAEYASTLDKLQKDFDKLTSEYKKLELNYSSLLKTARAEIERKTQIISNLNIEKDKMVLKSFQNKNVPPIGGSKAHKPMLGQNYKEDTDIKFERNTKIKEIEEHRKPSPPNAIERKEQGYLTPKSTEASPHIDIREKLLNMANGGLRQVDPRMKNNDMKENIMQPKKVTDTIRSSALIKTRRKSMPAVSFEMENVRKNTDDVGLTSPGDSKDYSRENTGGRHLDRNLSDRQSSRISETSSLEDRNSGCQELLSDAHNNRYSRYDNHKIDRYRVRDKSSHRHKRQSPDRYQREPKEFAYHRAEYDRHRPKRRVLESPPKDKYHWRPSRDLHQNNDERNHAHEQKHRSQERYPMKHKIQHSYDDSDSKRIKIDPHYRQHEDQRLQEEREFKMTYSTDPFNIQFSSCESPDYNHPVVSTHQIREIKLTAATKLDDPRMSNTKYILKKNNGKVALCTVQGINVEIVPINKIAWGIKPVTMPEALVRRPSIEVKQSAKEIIEIENPVANISMESGEICDLECLDSQNDPKEIVNETKFSKSDKELPAIKIDETKDIENYLQNINSYKIPKLKKTVDDKQIRKRTKDINPLVKPVFVNTIYKSKNSDSAIKNIGKSKPLIKPVKEKTLLEEKKEDSVFIHSNNGLPNLGNSNISDELKCLTAKGVVEDDLELSDDNCEQPNYITKENVDIHVQKKKKNNSQSCKDETVKIDTNASEKVTVVTCKNKTTNDVKKSKNKKKAKHKELIEECKSKVSPQVSKKLRKKKEKEKEMKTQQMKTKFSELFDDSSSLISPEDLGLATVPISTTRLSYKGVPIFEDALDATDLNAIKTVKDSIPFEKSHNEECKQSIDNTNRKKIDIVCTVSQESMKEASDIQSAKTEDIIKSIYKNLEPDIPEKEKNVMKTVIISAGVQPQFEIEKQDNGVQPQIEIEKKDECVQPKIVTKSEKCELANKTELQMQIARQEVALKALATSTPHKIELSSVVKSDVEANRSNTNSNSGANDSQKAIVENSAVLDTSDSNTLDSQTNSTDVPDVRIFVRRRRKVFKK